MGDIVSMEVARNRRAVSRDMFDEGWPAPTQETLREAELMKEYLPPEDWRAWCLGRGLEVFCTYTAVLPQVPGHEGDNP